MLVDFSAGASDLLDRSHRRHRRPRAVGAGGDRAPSAAADPTGRAAAQLPRARPDGAALSARASPIPATTSSRRTSTSSKGTAVEWEEQSFSVNGSKWGADRPAFPLLQAEKVLSLPLELRLNQDYRYELAGMERVGELECYRVRFEPTTDDAALYRRHGVDRSAIVCQGARASGANAHGGADCLERGDPHLRGGGERRRHADLTC